MITKLDLLRWENYKHKKENVILYGLENGFIKPFDDELIEKGRTIYYGGMPLSVFLISIRLANGHCYDRSLLIALAMPDDAEYEMVDADIDGITLNPEYLSTYRDSKKFGNGNKHYGNHCVIERKMSDGTIWVYDPSVGHAFRKELYVAIENPKETIRHTKEEVESYPEYQDIKNCDISHDKYVLPLVIPPIETLAALTQGEEGVKLRREIEIYKEAINYDEVLNEVNNDMLIKGITKKL